MTFVIKRIYEQPEGSDGMRVLVDRLWPRGIKRAHAQLFLWMRDVAPSTKLRLAFNHRPESFAEFRRRYARELAGNPALAELRKFGKRGRVTLLYAARAPKVNHAVVLQSILRRSASRKR